MTSTEPDAAAPLPAMDGDPLRCWPSDEAHDGRRLLSYEAGLRLMQRLCERPPTAPDVLLVVEHPPTITLGRRGDAAHIHGRWLRGAAGAGRQVAVHEVARGGDVTWHGPGQLVVYPIVQLTQLHGPIGRGPIGDLPALVRSLEEAIIEACASFGLITCLRAGFSGVWIDERTKLASIGVGVQRGWSLHGLALNVEPRLEGFDLITPCGLQGVQMSSIRREFERAGRNPPSWSAVESALLTALSRRLRRRAAEVAAAPQAVAASSPAGHGAVGSGAR